MISGTLHIMYTYLQAMQGHVTAAYLHAERVQATWWLYCTEPHFKKSIKIKIPIIDLRISFMLF